MNEHTAAATQPGTDGLWRWLVGGLIGGAIILGLLIGAYTIGYDHGQHHTKASTPTASPTTPSTPTTTTGTALGPVTATPALLARGKALYTSDGCAACHSLTGTAGVGPSVKSLAGSTVTLDNGQTVTADDAYLEQSITNPDAQIVKGYHAGAMTAAIAGHDLAGNPNDVRALVVFIKAQT
jgi:mono/diheme cytochrome c family protein